MNVTQKGRWYVSAQILLFIAYTLSVRMMSFSLNEFLLFLSVGIMILGILLIVIALIQLNSNLSPFPKPVKGARLITSGIYSISRHPIYIGIVMLAMGYGLYTTSLYKIIVGLFILILFYFKSRYEEQLLSAAFVEYVDYKRKVRRFF